MEKEPRCAANIYYHDDKIIYKDKKYQVDKLITMGWLLCRHWDEHTQAKELWHIINPELSTTINKSKVIKFFMDLIYIAVDLNLKLLNSPDNPNLKPGKKRNNAILYLADCVKGKGKISRQIQALGPEITQDELIELMQPYFRTSTIRMTLAGREFEVEESSGEEDDEESEEEGVPQVEDKSGKTPD